MKNESHIARYSSLAFHSEITPKKHKSLPAPPISASGNIATLRSELFALAPGLDAMERLLERSEDIVFCIKNRHHQYLSVNEAFLRRVRVSDRAAILGRTAREIFPPLLAVGYEQQDALVFSRGVDIRDRLEMISNRDGSTGWYIADKVPVRDTTGTLIALAGTSRRLHAHGENDPRLGRLARAVERMRLEYSSPIRIAGLAEDAGMSLSRFERLMHSVLRVSPRQFLTRLRIEAAADLLRGGSLPLSRIALDCGFCDQPTFCRQFKDATGVAPGTYRRLAQ